MVASEIYNFFNNLKHCVIFKNDLFKISRHMYNFNPARTQERIIINAAVSLIDLEYDAGSNVNLALVSDKAHFTLNGRKSFNKSRKIVKNLQKCTI